MIHLDTSYLIRALVPGSPEDARLRGWIAGRTPVAISAICWTEFLCGPLGPSEIELAGRLVGEPIGYTRPHAERAAALFNLAGRTRGSLVGCMVAAIALGAGANLATNDRMDFRRFEAAGLQLAGD